MELKLSKSALLSSSRDLLIVPYGIETRNKSGEAGKAGLLIVPYGIETVTGSGTPTKRELLIVPYGIETQTILKFSI